MPIFAARFPKGPGSTQPLHNMNITQEKNDTQRAVIKVTMQPADYQPRFEEALKRYRRQVAMPGFRQGKVPLGIIKNRYGKALLADELNQMLDEGLRNYLSQEKLAVLGAPIPVDEYASPGNWDNPGDFEFTYEVGLAPNVDANIDSSDALNYYTIRIDDAMLDERLDNFLKRRSTLQPVDAITPDAVVRAELVQLDDNGEIKPGGIFKEVTLFMEDATEQGKAALLGLQEGSEADVDPYQLEPNYDKLGRMLGIAHHDVHHLHGNMRVRVKSINQPVRPELNQEFFDEVFGPGTVEGIEAFREKFREMVAKSYQEDSRSLFVRDLITHLLKKHSFELPDDFLKRYIRLTNEKPISAEQLEYDYPRYRESLKWDILRRSLAAKGIGTVQQSEVVERMKARIVSNYTSYGIEAPPEEELNNMAANYLKKEDYFNSVADDLFNEKLYAAGREMATVTEKEVSFAQFEEMAKNG
jgi:trigger factor